MAPTPSTPRVLTLTLNPSIDVSTTTEKVRPEHKLRCSSALLDAGGGGINVSRVVRELGAMTLAIYPEGGITGSLLTQRLAARGIPSAAVSCRARTRVCFNASDTSAGHEYRFILPGVRLEPDELASCLDRVDAELTDADVLVASGSLPPGVPEDLYAQLTRRVRARGVKVVLDTSGPALRTALGSGLLLVKPSRREMAEAMGEPLQDLRSLAAACRKVQRSGAAEVLAVSMGSEGAILTSSSGQWLGVPPKVEARSAVGAGDSFVGAMTLSLLRGEPHDVALAWASAAGAAALLAPGTELCSRADAERLRSQVKVTPVE
ncbi:MAG TPA: 1-phosphofructokinase family hexose kinase [Myxococcaceae bacterium]